MLKFSPGMLLTFFTAINLLIYIDRGVLSSVLTILKNPLEPEQPASIETSGFNSSAEISDTPEQITGLGIDESEQGSLGSMFMLGFMASAPIFAHYSQMYHPFYLIGIGLVIWGLSSILAATSFSYLQLVLSRAFSGIGEASFVSLAPPIILDSASDKNKSIWMAIFYTTIPLGYACGYLFGGFIVEVFNSWRVAFSLEGIIAIPAIIICILSEKDPKMLARGKENKQSDEVQVLDFVTQVKKLWTNILFVFITFGYAAFVFTVGAFGYWIPTIFKQLFGISESLGNILSGILTLVCSLVGTLSGACILDFLVYKLVSFEGLDESKKKKVLKHKYSQYACIFLTITTFIGCLGGVIGTLHNSFVGFTIGLIFAELCIFLY